MKKAIIIAVTAFALLGCKPTAEDVQLAAAYNATSLASPDLVGRLPDGRAVMHARLERADTSYSQHIYFVENAAVTTNSAVSQGKTSAPTVQAVISATSTPDEIIAYAKKLEDQQLREKQETWERLGKELGK